ncbi:AI-2E family transporter [Parasegetibacter sp. NRK P23]|uniref:AI-2E family transporter n=1 Tax=Parasegetibacter sp. NRK P23 TaxID=2942999 RepID=UPI002042E413|nr:AI-2E family transporter [Parasegetibacter sp. NRK P23]MCM5527485.1 AI-2E family transporter [Parasegetibacter sp. NRK P23]
METKLSDRKMNKYLFLTIILLFGGFLFFSLIEFFTGFLGAIMFYVLAKPSMCRLLKKGWNKSLAAVVIIVISFFIILLPISLLGAMLYNKISAFVSDPEALVSALKEFDQRIQSQYNFKLLSEKNISNIEGFATGAIQSILNESLGIFGTITMMYFFLYFMLYNVNRMEAAIVFYLPFQRRKIELFGQELVAQTFSNAVGVPLIAVAQGLCGYGGYLIAGLPEAGFWGIITGFSSIIPIVGTGLVWVPAGIYLLAGGSIWQGVFIIIWGAAALGSLDNVIRFMLAKRMADVHPVVTVLGVIIGLKYFNIPGLIFGPLLISYFIILLKIYYAEYQTDVPVIKKNKIRPVRFNLPFLGTKKP